MALLILQPISATPDENWADKVRSLLGVEVDDLPDDEVTASLNVDLAEAIIIRRVPTYQTITDPSDLLFLKMAVVAYIAYIFAPTMSARLKQAVQTLDMKWTNQTMDWTKREQELLGLSDFYISNILSIEVAQETVKIMGIGKQLPKGMLSNEQDIQTGGWWGMREAFSVERGDN